MLLRDPDAMVLFLFFVWFSAVKKQIHFLCSVQFPLDQSRVSKTKIYAFKMKKEEGTL